MHACVPVASTPVANENGCGGDPQESGVHGPTETVKISFGE